MKLSHFATDRTTTFILKALLAARVALRFCAPTGTVVQSKFPSLHISLEMYAKLMVAACTAG
jgi:hypothetical protein